MTRATDIRHRQLPNTKQFRKFDYVGNSAVKDSLNLTEQQLNFNNHLLSHMNIGDFLSIERICVGRQIARQLASLQFKTGTTIRLIDKTNHDSVLIELGDRLIGFNSEIARQIIVTSVDRTKL